MSANASLFATLALGFALGLRHALDADHVVAVSTLVARERSVWRSTQIGAIWGLGHTFTLLVMGVLIIVLGLQIPEFWAEKLELAVAAMLIFLGARTLWQWKRGEGHFCTHQHDGHSHTHFHRWGEHECAQQSEEKPRAAARQPFLVGVVHGLSGSAELMLLVLSTIRHPAWALTYIVIFGLGMMGAMFVLTSLFSFALGAASRFNGGWNRLDLTLRGLTGAASLGFGTHLAFGALRHA